MGVKHLGVKDAGSSLDNADSLIISLNLVHIARLARDHGNQVQTKILRVEIGGERVREGLLLASRDLDIVTSSRNVADNGSAGMYARCQWLQRGQRASDQSYLDGFRLIVREIQDSLCCVPIDELDAEDLSIGEGCGDRDGKVGCCGRSLELFFDLVTR
jgi:hypothetical protein